MNVDVPVYVFPFVLGGALAILGTLWLGLRAALERAHWPAPLRSRAVSGVMLLLAAWFLAALWPAWLGFYQSPPSGIPTIWIGILVPIVAGIALFRRWPLLREITQTIPQEWLVGVQVYRVMGGIFLVLLAADRLPGVFAWPAGLGDVLVGLIAPAVAILYARKPGSAGAWVRAWNTLGIADLIVAVGTGFLSSPSRFQTLALDAPNRLVSAFPLAMVPVYLVPLWVLLHLASLHKLRGSRTGEPVPRAALATN